VSASLPLNLLSLLLLPLLLSGWIQRVKALWSGRKGPPLLQPFHDLARLLRKVPVYSSTTTPLFRIGPWFLLATTLGSAALVPLSGARSLASFPFDFVWFAYAWGLGRVCLMLAALDTGSPFEGMGSAREALFSMLLEPVLFLGAAALCLKSGAHSFDAALRELGGAWLLRLCAVLALAIVLQVESARMPVDDPSTHLELTMVHEVMVLDHSGPDLAAVQLASALKLFIGSSLIATLLNPWAASGGLAAVGAQVLLSFAVATGVGTVESLIARLKLRLVPSYIALALGSSSVALLLGAWGALQVP
jgi:formate hydrogenlyase subunit 4